MPDCVVEGEAGFSAIALDHAVVATVMVVVGALPDEAAADGDDNVVVAAVELLSGMVELLITPVSLPSLPSRCRAAAFRVELEIGGGTYEPPGALVQT